MIDELVDDRFPLLSVAGGIGSIEPGQLVIVESDHARDVRRETFSARAVAPWIPPGSDSSGVGFEQANGFATVLVAHRHQLREIPGTLVEPVAMLIGHDGPPRARCRKTSDAAELPDLGELLLLAEIVADIVEMDPTPV